MPQPKPVTLTQIPEGEYEGAGAPQPLVIVGGDITGIDPQAAIANVGTADATDGATAATLANANKAKINAILAALRAAGVIAT